jgi:hypothetical protein
MHALAHSPTIKQSITEWVQSFPHLSDAEFGPKTIPSLMHAIDPLFEEHHNLPQILTLMEDWFTEHTAQNYFHSDQINPNNLTRLDEQLCLLEFIMIIVVQGSNKQQLIEQILGLSEEA